MVPTLAAVFETFSVPPSMVKLPSIFTVPEPVGDPIRYVPDVILRLPAIPNVIPLFDQMVLVPPLIIRLLYWRDAIFVVKVLRFHVAAAVFEKRTVELVMVCVPAPGVKPWLTSMIPELAQVRFPFPELLSWP